MTVFSFWWIAVLRRKEKKGCSGPRLISSPSTDVVIFVCAAQKQHSHVKVCRDYTSAQRCPALSSHYVAIQLLMCIICTAFACLRVCVFYAETVSPEICRRCLGLHKPSAFSAPASRLSPSLSLPKSLPSVLPLQIPVSCAGVYMHACACESVDIFPPFPPKNQDRGRENYSHVHSRDFRSATLLPLFFSLSFSLLHLRSIFSAPCLFLYHSHVILCALKLISSLLCATFRAPRLPVKSCSPLRTR